MMATDRNILPDEEEWTPAAEPVAMRFTSNIVGPIYLAADFL